MAVEVGGCGDCAHGCARRWHSWDASLGLYQCRACWRACAPFAFAFGFVERFPVDARLAGRPYDFDDETLFARAARKPLEL